MYKSAKNSEGRWVVENQAGEVIKVCETRAESRRLASEMTREALAEPTTAILAVDTDTLPVDSNVPTVEAELSETSADVAVDTADVPVNLESSKPAEEPAEEPNNMADVLTALKQFEQLAQSAKPAQSTVQVVKVEKRVTKASQVRARIAIAKQTSELPDVVVGWAVETLGMDKNLARVYVRNNWSKVPN